jgi:hypothetical protein
MTTLTRATAPAVTDTTPAVLLRAAADHLDSHGWQQGRLYHYGTDPGRPPRACTVGALFLAAGGRRARLGRIETPAAELRAAFRYLAGHLVDSGQLDLDQDQDDPCTWEGALADWNDHPGRTTGEVTTALRAAARRWDDTHPETTSS